jgi:hypothetical protein
MYYWRYGFTSTYLETLLTIIGSTQDIDTSYLETNDDTNCIYVAWTGDDGDAGTQAEPVRTIEQALTLAAGDTDISVITILDSNTYDTNITGDNYINLVGITLQGAAGQSPVLVVDTSAQNYMVKISGAGKLINVQLSIEDSGNQITGIEIESGTVKNVTIFGATREGISVPAGSTTVAIDNTYIYSSLNRGTTDGNAVKIAEGTVTLTRCLLVDNHRAGIYCTGADVKTVTIDYCTIAGNQYGVHAYSSTNAAIEVDNSILFENDIADYYHDSITVDDSCIGSISGLAEFERILFNPLFIGGGDYRIRTLQNGYTDGSYISPVISQSDTGKDLGCYDYERTTESTIYTEFITERPITFRKTDVALDATLKYTNTLVARQTDKGIISKLYLGWDQIVDEQFENLQDMYAAGGTIYLSIDNGLNFTAYKIDKTQPLEYSRTTNIDDMDYQAGVGLGLIVA